MTKRLTRVMRATVVTGMRTTAFAPWSPAVDLYENEDELIVFMDAAGVSPGEIEIMADARNLTIRGKRDCPISGIISVHQLEIEYGRFECRLQLPKAIDVDKTTSVSKNGFLVIKMPIVKTDGNIVIS